MTMENTCTKVKVGKKT